MLYTFNVETLKGAVALKRLRATSLRQQTALKALLLFQVYKQFVKNYMNSLHKNEDQEF